MDRVCLEPQDNTDNTGNQLFESKIFAEEFRKFELFIMSFQNHHESK